MTTSAMKNKLEPIYLLYDERMLQHRPIGWKEPQSFPRYKEDVDENYPIENPKRVQVIYDRLLHLGQRLMEHNDLFYECDDVSSSPPFMQRTDKVIYKHLSCRMASKEEILLAHSEDQYNQLSMLELMTDTELDKKSQNSMNDIYYCQKSFEVARLAAGGLLACVDAICTHQTTQTSIATLPQQAVSNTNKALALVRPPGHHACQNEEMGFCFIDSVVVAAKYALTTQKAKRVVILDWDIHDGNATAEATIQDENIFRVDLHRYNLIHPFYPFTGSPKDVGRKEAKGLNLNVTWSLGGMGDREYAAAFYELILPLIVDYNPDLIIISCGLDAAMGDLLGDCCLTPGFYHAMTRAAIEVIGPETPVLCALEGGYTINVLPDCMEAVTLAMLNLPFFYHSSEQFMGAYYSSFSSGAAEISQQDNTSEAQSSKADALCQSRNALSNYYNRLEIILIQVCRSAVKDINNSIRIFHKLDRWKHLPLECISTKTLQSHQKKVTGKKHSLNEVSATGNRSTDDWPIPFSRPRTYLWYGSEDYHKKVRKSHDSLMFF